MSRKVQASFGLFTGVVVYSAAFGGLFAWCSPSRQGRIGNVAPRAYRALLAVLGHRRALHRAEPEISGKPAVGRRSGYDRHPHRALFSDNADFARGHGHRGHRAAAPRASIRRLVCRVDRRGRLYRRRHRGAAPPPPINEVPEGFPGSSAVELPHGVARDTGRHVDDDPG